MFMGGWWVGMGVMDRCNLRLYGCESPFLTYAYLNAFMSALWPIILPKVI